VFRIYSSSHISGRNRLIEGPGAYYSHIISVILNIMIPLRVKILNGGYNISHTNVGSTIVRNNCCTSIFEIRFNTLTYYYGGQ